MKYRHKKRGSIYTVLGEAELQCSAPVAEGAALVVYQAADGKLWARPKEEFFDGRFEEVESDSFSRPAGEG